MFYIYIAIHVYLFLLLAVDSERAIANKALEGIDKTLKAKVKLQKQLDISKPAPNYPIQFLDELIQLEADFLKTGTLKFVS